MGVRIVEVEAHAGQRLDNFLFRELKGVPKSRVYRLVRRGEVRVNGRRKAISYRLENGDKVRIPPVRMGDPQADGPKPRTDWIKAATLFDSSDLLVLNKPSGIAVHGGSGVSAGVIEMLRHADPHGTYELAHRLDRDTSGCLAIARNRSTLLALHEAFREGLVRKRYEAVVMGAWPAGLRTVRSPLLRYALANGERRVRVDSAGDAARTDFEIVERADGVGAATWLAVFPRTGRTHQIRVHAASNGHPVLGDDKYGGRDGAAKAPRLMLHAASLRFPDGRRFEAEPDERFKTIWKRIKSEG